MRKLLLLTIIALFIPSVVLAVDEADATKVQPKEAWLQSHEANRLGWTFDSNDVGYMDFTVSLKYPFLSLDNAIAAKKNVRDGNTFKDLQTKYFRSIPYLAFTGRFSQYVGTRKSSPVIGKKFKPELFLRFFTSDPADSYLDVGYGHESNGQRINSQAAYQDLQDDFAREGEDPLFANDYISRGWDYLGLSWFRNFTGAADGSDDGFSTYLNLRYFLYDGLLQGEPEEYNSWENDTRGAPRNEFDGIMIDLKYKRPIRDLFKMWGVPLGVGGWDVIYNTGYKRAFTNNSIRGELLIRIGTIPLLCWISEGYNSDLVDYFRRVRSGGVALDLKTF